MSDAVSSCVGLSGLVGVFVPVLCASEEGDVDVVGVGPSSEGPKCKIFPPRRCKTGMAWMDRCVWVRGIRCRALSSRRYLVGAPKKRRREGVRFHSRNGKTMFTMPSFRLQDYSFEIQELSDAECSSVKCAVKLPSHVNPQRRWSCDR